MIPAAEVQSPEQYDAARADDLISRVLSLLIQEAAAVGRTPEATFSGAMMALDRAVAEEIIKQGQTPTARAIVHVLTPALHKNATALWQAYQANQKARSADMPTSTIM